MKKFLFIPLITISYYLLLFITSSGTLAQGLPIGRTENNLSDYQYQLDQYRINYAEYQLFKNDYENNPTLNNEQKAVLAAKRAIISRELGIPCIVGTRGATKALKTGDLVEVDADKGLVRILKEK